MSITSFHCEGVDSKTIITGLRQRVKEFGDGMNAAWKEDGKIKLMIIVGCLGPAETAI